MFLEEEMFKRMVTEYIRHTYDYGIEIVEMFPTLYNHQRSSISKLHASRRWIHLSLASYSYS